MLTGPFTVRQKPSSKRVNLGEKITIDIDIDGGMKPYTISGECSARINQENAAYYWTAPGKPGSYPLTVIVTDANKRVTKSRVTMGGAEAAATGSQLWKGTAARTMPMLLAIPS